MALIFLWTIKVITALSKNIVTTKVFNITLIIINCILLPTKLWNIIGKY